MDGDGDGDVDEMSGGLQEIVDQQVQKVHLKG